MSKIHITLVGGQTIPVYYGIVDSCPERVIFICSQSSKEEGLRIQKEIAIDSEIREFDPLDFDKIYKGIKELLKEFTDNDILSVNVISGTKQWSLAFFSIFSKMKNATVITIDQNNKCFDLISDKSHIININMDCDKYFRLCGNEMKSYTSFSDYTEEDFNVMQEVEKLRKSNVQAFNKLTIDLYNNNDKLISTDDKSGSIIEINPDTNVYHCQICGRYKTYKKDLFSPHIEQILFNSGWFELKVASMLSQWDKAKDIRMNCKFESKNRKEKNEIDIIVVTENKLMFVECKTQVKKSTDVDKFNSVCHNYGGIGSKSLFVTDAVMESAAKEKCEGYGIPVFSLETNLSYEVQQKLLFAMLDNELIRSNKK